MTRFLRLAGAAVVVLLTVAFGAGATPTAHATTALPAGNAPAGSGDITLLSQTPWIDQRGLFRMRLEIHAANPRADRIQVLVFPGLSTRTDFDNAAAGKFASFAACCGSAPLSSISRERSGAYDIDIPVNQASGDSGAKTPFSRFNTAIAAPVYPVEVSMVQGSQTVGAPIDTFLVAAAGPPSVTKYPRLSVAVALPVWSPPRLGKDAGLDPVAPAESARLSGVVGALAQHPDVPVTVQATPQTLEALKEGNPTDGATLATLGGLAQTGQAEVVPSTYAPVSIADLQSSGLPGEIDQQMKSGASVVAGLLQVTPSRRTWVINGQVDLPTVSTLSGLGATQLVVPDADLTPLPAAATFYGYFPKPTRLLGGPSVFAADPGLTNDLTRSGSDVVAANQLLADLAMIQSIQPGTPDQGVVVLPPSGWQPGPTFVSTLVAGLSGNPLLKAVTVSGLFASVPVAPGVSRDLSGANSAAVDLSLASDAQAIRAARGGIDALSTVFAGDERERAEANTLQAQLLTAESTEVDMTARQALLGTVVQAVTKTLKKITLPPESSITLTSTHGQIPLTVLASPSLTAQVRLTLTSQRLIFQPFTPPEGHCQVPTPTSVVCSLTLSTQNTTIKVPVQARSAGVFPLDVELRSPDGNDLLAVRSDTVHSTAVSGVGVILIIVAGVSLAVWWARDLHRGRRARRLVPSPIAIDLTLDEPVERFFREPPDRGAP